MRMIILAAGAALSLAACSGSNSAANNDLNATDNMALDQNMTLDQNAGMTADMNATGGMDGNVATNAATENAMAKDRNTNDPDTNLANGM